MLGLIFYLFFLILLSGIMNFQMLLASLCLLILISIFYFPVNLNVIGNLGLSFGCDMLSYILFFLSLWIMLLALLSSFSIFILNMNFLVFIFFSLLLLLSLVFSFLVLDLLYFYLSFEASLIPLTLLVIGYGNQPEKVKAGMYMLFYTVFGSLPLLLGMMYIYSILGSVCYFYYTEMMLSVSSYLFMLINFAFLVKLPGYLVHLWLPKAHVEAPVLGSMILAGIMLKLGGYGMIRFISLFLPFLYNYMDYLLSFSLVGAILMSLVCLCQSDMKALVAYSSVGHMGIFMGGLFGLNYYGYLGAVIMMVSHGLTSSALFSLVNMIYERVHTRSLMMVRGVMMVIPSLSMLWFIFSASNMGVPPFLNLFGELFLSFSLGSLDMINMLFLGMLYFLGGCYSLYFFSITQQGCMWGILGIYNNLSLREFLLLWLHLLPLLFLVLKLNLLG